MNADRIGPAMLDLMAESEAIRESNLHPFDPTDGIRRVSSLLIDQVAHSYTVGASHMQGIIDAIKTLERIGTGTNAESATLFERAPLTGLRHQHYLSAVFLPKNIELELKEMDESVFYARVAEIMGNAKLTNRQKANHIAHFAIDESFTRRNQKQRMTGEWAVFARDGAGVNHYLAAGAHAPKAVCQALLDLMRAPCEPQFVALLP